MTALNFKQLRQDAMSTITGWYTATIVEASAVRNSKNNPMIKAKLKITGGQYDGRPIWNNFNITPDSPGALRMFFGQMAVLGLDEAFFDGMPNFDNVPEPEMASAGYIAQALQGRTADIEIGVRQWQGQDREEIKNWRASSGVPTGAAIPTALPSALPTALPTATPAAATPPPSTSELPGTLPSSPPPADPF